MISVKDNRIKSVIIPSGITSIGANTFSECDELINMTIGNGMTTIGYRAFFDCGDLRNVIIPQNCKIGDDTFPHRCKIIRK